MKDFYTSVFEGTIQEAKDYIRKNHSDCRWNCPTGTEDAEGIINVLESTDVDVTIEIDGNGNIRCVGDLDVFASIVEDEN